MSVTAPGLIQSDWETLARETTIRYFSSDKFFPSQDPEVIWRLMGENITCSVDEGGEATVIVPESFKSDKPFKIFTHGFASKVKEDPKTAFVDGKNSYPLLIIQIWNNVKTSWG